MKVVMINPSSPWADTPAMNPPLGLAYLSAWLKSHGVKDIMGIDLDLDGVTVFSIPDDADVYAITCMTPQYKQVCLITAHIHMINPTAKIVVGGSHFSSMPEDIPKHATHVIRGDGEYALLCLVRGVKVNQQHVHRMSNFDALPHPDRDLFGMENYKRTLDGKPAAHVVTLKGCPFNCSFCDRTSVSRKVQYRSVKNVIDELEMIEGEYGIDHFIFYDDIFTLDKDRLYRLCAEFKKRAYRWRCWSRADTLDRDTLRIMKESGLVSLTMGIESGDNTVLAKIDKKITADKNRQALTWCKELRIPVRCSLMFGNPGECKRSVDNTIRLVEETQPDEWNLAVLVPIPGSPIWENPSKYGVVFNKDELKARAYAGTDRFSDNGIGYVSCDLEGLDKENLSELLAYFVSELERACPRKNIQDTIQHIDLEKVGACV